MHPLVKSKSGIVDQKVDEDCSLDIFEMIASISDSTKKLINKKARDFQATSSGYQRYEVPFSMMVKT